MSQTEPPIDPRLDLAAYVERCLWDAYRDGVKQAKLLGGSSRVVLEAKADILSLAKAHQYQAVKEARLTDNHDWDTESFKRQDVIVCTRCATTYQTRGNKPCKGKMAKITLREANNTGDEV